MADEQVPRLHKDTDLFRAALSFTERNFGFCARLLTVRRQCGDNAAARATTMTSLVARRITACYRFRLGRISVGLSACSLAGMAWRHIG